MKVGRIRGMSFLQSGRASIAAVLPANNPDRAYPEARGRPTHSVQPIAASKLIVSNDNSSLASISFRAAFPVGAKPIEARETVFVTATL